MISTTLLCLAALARAAGGDVSCAAACARCAGDRAGSELSVVYCSLCRECRDRRREWLETTPRRDAPQRRQLAPVAPPAQAHYREEAAAAYYRDARSAVATNAPVAYNAAPAYSAPQGGYNAAPGAYNTGSCPPPPRCDDDGQFYYVKVYGLKRDASTCPPAPPCPPQTAPPPPPPTYAPPPPLPRQTLPPSTPPPPRPASTGGYCCPMFAMPMMPYPCVCPPFDPNSPYGSGAYGAGAYGPAGAHGPSPGASAPGADAADPGAVSEQAPSTSDVYLYIGIPKDMQNVITA